MISSTSRLMNFKIGLPLDCSPVTKCYAQHLGIRNLYRIPITETQLVPFQKFPGPFAQGVLDCVDCQLLFVICLLDNNRETGSASNGQNATATTVGLGSRDNTAMVI